MVLMQRIVKSTCRLILWWSVACCPILAMAQPADIRLIVEQRTQDGINVNFGLRVDAPRLFFGALPGQITAPDGTNFTRFANSASNLNFQDLGNRFFGNWTIGERTFTGDANHTFTFNGFVLTDVFTEIPTIVAPVRSGQTGVVGTSFEVAWVFPSGVTPSSQVATSGGGGGTITFGSFGPNSVQATAALNAGVEQATFNVSAGSTSSLSSFLSGVTRDPSGRGTSWSLLGSFFNLSQPAQITVTSVPEPGPLWLASLVCVGWLTRRRHRFTGGTDSQRVLKS